MLVATTLSIGEKVLEPEFGALIQKDLTLGGSKVMEEDSSMSIFEPSLELMPLSKPGLDLYELANNY